MTNIKALFLDIGGVLLTNGWDHPLRQKAADVFGLEFTEMNKRHSLIFDTFESGKMSFDDYLNYVIFYEKRNYSPQDVKQFIFESAKAYPEMIALIKKIKKQHNLKVALVSNEGKEIAIDRIQRFELASFADFYVISGFVQLRKPDKDIYHLAIDIAQIAPENIAYLDDRPYLIEVAKSLGFNAIHHRDAVTTESELNRLFNLSRT